MTAAVPVPDTRTELGGVEHALQRASGIGLGAFTAQSLAVAVTGWPLYPAWWYLVPAPAMFAAMVVAIVTCMRGRSVRIGRLITVVVVTVGSVTTAAATAGTVHVVGNASSALVTALAILLGLFEPPKVALPAGAVLIAGQVGSVALTRPLPTGELATVAAIQVAVLLAGVVTRRVLRRAASEQDKLTERLAEALAADRVAWATRRDRREQERRLHDTVLSTLTAIARSSLTESDRLRDRCAADARYLRTLQRRAGEERTPRMELVDVLRTLARDRASPGSRIDVVCDEGPAGPELPDDVVDALTRAAGEGVANAVRHSGTDVVEIRVRRSTERVVVEVIDHGRGTGPVAGGDGLGIRRSIQERMADAGGTGRVHRVAGAGTSVVLTWPD